MEKIQRKDFYFTCADALSTHAIWLAELVEELALQKPHLVEGTTFQIGWSILKLVEKSDGLALCEPDFDSDPFTHFREDVSATLTVLVEQRELLAKVGCSPVDVRFDDKMIVFKDCLNEANIYGQRQEPDDGDSGWYIGPTRDHDSDEEDNLESIWVFELLQRRPHILAALCLPADWMVVWNGTEIEGIADENDEEMLR